MNAGNLRATNRPPDKVSPSQLRKIIFQRIGILLSACLLNVPSITSASDNRQQKIDRQFPLSVAQGANQNPLFRRPTFNIEKSLAAARIQLRKEGHYLPKLIEMLAREKVDRSWRALEVKADRFIAARDYFSAIKVYDEILAALHPDHLTARHSVLQQRLIAYRSFGYVGARIKSAEDEQRGTRRQICTIEREGYARMSASKHRARYESASMCLKKFANNGQMRADRPASNDRCDKQKVAGLSPGTKSIFELACANNFSFSLAANFPYASLINYIKDEDGAKPLIRTGYEVQLYRMLKHRYLNQELFRPLPSFRLFTATVFAILHKEREKDKKRHVIVNVLDVLLTAHNVTRLLARPEQWFGTYPLTDAGQNRTMHDRARPIFDDLMGVRSVDQYPSFYQYSRARRNDFRNRVLDVFFGPNGVYEYNSRASEANDGWRPSHWNGGVHYYYWIGAVVQWIGNQSKFGSGGGFAGRNIAYFYELLQKSLLSSRRRAEVQLDTGFTPGARTTAQFIDALNELEKLDQRFVRR